MNKKPFLDLREGVFFPEAKASVTRWLDNVSNTCPNVKMKMCAMA